MYLILYRVSADIQQAHIQFLSNVIRNDTAEIENIIRSSVSFVYFHTAD